MRARRPAGTLRLPRALLASGALLDLVRLAERQEMDAHPLERVMDVQDGPDDLFVTTTGVYLAGVITGMLERRLQRRPRVHHPRAGEVGVEWEDPGRELALERVLATGRPSEPHALHLVEVSAPCEVRA